MSVQSFTITIAQSILDDLRERLARTRWPDEVEGTGWDYGTNLAYLKTLVDYWQRHFDWRAQEAMLNHFAQFRVEIDGKPFTDFVLRGGEAMKPYLHPLRSATGKIVTRHFPMETVKGSPWTIRISAAFGSPTTASTDSTSGIMRPITRHRSGGGSWSIRSPASRVASRPEASEPSSAGSTRTTSSCSTNPFR